MIFESYDEYKDSNVEFLKNIPNEWEVQRIKNISKIFGRIGFRGYTVSDLVDEGEGPITLGPPNIENQKLNFDKKTYISWEKYEESPEIKIYNDDIILVKTASVGKVAYVENLNEPATINPQLVVFKDIDINPKFFYYCLRSDLIQNQISSDLKGGVVSTLTQVNILNYFLTIPPINTQRLIATFLDDKISQIDQLIEKNQKLIELLEEKRTSLINQAVTKGLDPNVPMKDSCIDWIGEIPKHWEITKISNLFSLIGSGSTPKSSINEYYEKGDVNWLITGDLNDGEIYKTSKKITKETFNEYSTLKMYPINSLVIAMYGATIGKVGILKINACTNQACCTLANSSKLNIKFAYYWFLANKKNLISLSYGGGQPNISQDTIKNLKIQVPKKTEQKEICVYLDIHVTEINHLIEKIQKENELLEEYKQSLIYNVVTGKVKVEGE